MRRLLRWVGAVVVVLVVGSALGIGVARIIDDSRTAAAVEDQTVVIGELRDVVDRLDRQNRRLTRVIGELDQTERDIACMVRELGRTFVAGVRVLLADEDDPATLALFNELEAQLAELEEAVGGDCPEETP